MVEAAGAGAVGAGGPSVVVVGSANVDLSIPVDHLPQPGETVLGGEVLRGPGGKGANQAVAAARLGAGAALVGRVGDDEEGRWLRDRLDADGVDTRGLLATAEGATGLAVISVDAEGENSIVVAPGANHRVGAADVRPLRQMVTPSTVILTQLEIPLEVVNGLAGELAGVPRGCLILNPAPAPAPARAGVELSAFDVVVPNRGELALLAGGAVTPDVATAADQARTLDVPVVVVTLGAQGAMVVFNQRESSGTVGERGRAAEVVVLPALPVNAVDTTAAGDSFCGALAVALAEGASMVEAAGWAIRAAGLTVTRRGAQDSLPRRSDVGPWANPNPNP